MDEKVGPIAPAKPITPAFKMRPKSLSSLMSGFQSSVTSKINQLRGTPERSVWQSNYYDRIIRNNNELNRIRKYIIDNPGNHHRRSYRLKGSYFVTICVHDM